MAEINPERAAIIQQITVLGQALYDALESQNTVGVTHLHRIGAN